jgi:hypothetical protein
MGRQLVEGALGIYDVGSDKLVRKIPVGWSGPITEYFSASAYGLRFGRRMPVALAVVTESSPPAFPCGLCRQLLLEFAEDDLPILVTNIQGERQETTLGALIPHGFRLGPENWAPTPPRPE